MWNELCEICPKELEQFLMMDDIPCYKVTIYKYKIKPRCLVFLFIYYVTLQIKLKVYKTCILKILSEIDPKYNLL